MGALCCHQKVPSPRRNLSATFNVSAWQEYSAELVNINVATEEELMTLPGISRLTAQHIVEHRKQIGSFRRVEDLACVSGVGATKLSELRLDICVGGSTSDLSDTVSRCSSATTRTSTKTVHLNTANVFQLLRTRALSQQLAERIVAHRDKRGHFTSLDELLKVRGVKPAVLSALRPHLVLSDSPPDSGIESPDEWPLNSHRPDELPLNSPRPKKSPVPRRRHHKNLLRLASWNLQQLSTDKASNPGVMETIAMTLLENGLSVVAVRDVLDTQALVTLCGELNAPQLPTVKAWCGERGCWHWTASDKHTGHGFLYDSSRGLELERVTTLGTGSLQAIFSVDRLRLAVVSVADQGVLEETATELTSLVGEANIVLLGEWRTDCAVPPPGYKPVLTQDQTRTNPCDNIWMNSQSETFFTGLCGVVTEGLTSPWIPCGWRWGGAVSHFSPAWAELYTVSYTQQAQQLLRRISASLT